MTKLSGMLTVTPLKNRAVAISVKASFHSILFLGATMRSSAEASGKSRAQHASIVLYPENETPGLIAISVATETGKDRRGYRNTSFAPQFLKLEWPAGEEDGVRYPYVELDAPWFSPERIGNVTDYGIEVVVRDKRIASYMNDGGSKTLIAPDGNLLCRYLWGTARAHEVLHAVVQPKLEQNAKKFLPELEKLRKDNSRLTRDLWDMTREASQSNQRVAGAHYALKIFCGWVETAMYHRSVRWMLRWQNPKLLDALKRVTEYGEHDGATQASLIRGIAYPGD